MIARNIMFLMSYAYPLLTSFITTVIVSYF